MKPARHGDRVGELGKELLLLAVVRAAGRKGSVWKNVSNGEQINDINAEGGKQEEQNQGRRRNRRFLQAENRCVLMPPPFLLLPTLSFSFFCITIRVTLVYGTGNLIAVRRVSEYLDRLKR